MLTKIIAVTTGIILVLSPLVTMMAQAQVISNSNEEVSLIKQNKDTQKLVEEISKVLTADQKAKLKNDLTQQVGLRDALGKLNLTIDQKRQISKIMTENGAGPLPLIPRK